MERKLRSIQTYVASQELRLLELQEQVLSGGPRQVRISDSDGKLLCGCGQSKCVRAAQMAGCPRNRPQEPQEEGGTEWMLGRFRPDRFFPLDDDREVEIFLAREDIRTAWREYAFARAPVHCVAFPALFMKQLLSVRYLRSHVFST